MENLKLEILGDLIKIIREMIGNIVVQININYRLKDDIELDSLDLVELIMEIESLYNIQIPDEDVQDINQWSLKDLVDYLYGSHLKRTHKPIKENDMTTSTIFEKPDTSQIQFKYGDLIKSKTTGNILLVTSTYGSKFDAVIIHPKNANSMIGSYARELSPNGFTPFYGEITLKS